MKYPKISMIIGSFNRLPMLKICIDAVRKELINQDFEIIVVDGGSTDGAVEWLTQQKDIVSIIQHNRGEWLGKKIERKPWAYFMNLAFKAASGKYICMLSDDSLIVPGAINNGVGLFDLMLEQKIKIGAVAFYFRDYPIRKKYAVAVNIGNLYVNHGLYLRDAVEEVGFISEDYHFYFADTDLIMKIKSQGYACVPSLGSFVEHYFEATPEIRASNNDTKKDDDRNRLIDNWKGKGYPDVDYQKYKKIVGYWDWHPGGFEDPDNTIEKLIEAHKSVN
jgi:glycosyltransferase involved in cell wall biosynthesis